MSAVLHAARELASRLREAPSVALTGAGVSTDSGIPDYRGPASLGRVRTPIQHRDFLRDPETRRRYWARAVVGWERFHDASPNATHRALATLEDRGALSGIITQNVDRLHHRAGSRSIVELHGALEDVVCLACGARSHRDELQKRLRDANPTFFERHVDRAHVSGSDVPPGMESAEARPDGDTELDKSAVLEFRPVGCALCGGDLKPAVVFFGDNVARPVVDRAFAMLEDVAHARGTLLVLGTSLAVFSGYRFVRRAKDLGMTVAIVNLGPTRGDPHADVRIDAPVGEVVPALVAAACEPAVTTT
ncbi:MAG: Sir2 family NAD-dependent protein deacetylase [Polyangiaceae bacterium]